MGFADDGLIMLNDDETGSGWDKRQFSDLVKPANLALGFGVDDEMLHLRDGLTVFWGNHRDRVDLDDEITIEELERLDPLFMPIFCKLDVEREGEVDAVRGLIIVSIGKNGEYRRIGSGAAHSYAVVPLLCSLGNQEISNSRNESSEPPSNLRLLAPIDIRPHARIPSSEFIPTEWPAKGLEFIPKDYALYDITIV